MVGGSVVEAWWRSFRNSPGQKSIGPLQNDRERRDMMAAGAAAGLSAAFGAPVGKYIIFNFKSIQNNYFIF
jgi:H+/Cl- antiporter ClcA